MSSRRGLATLPIANPLSCSARYASNDASARFWGAVDNLSRSLSHRSAYEINNAKCLQMRRGVGMAAWDSTWPLKCPLNISQTNKLVEGGKRERVSFCDGVGTIPTVCLL